MGAIEAQKKVRKKSVPRAAASETQKRASDMPIPAVGPIIRRVRLQRGMSLQQLAEAANVSIGTLSQIERNLSNPSLGVVTNIRQALRIPLSALFEDERSEGDPLYDPKFVRRLHHRPRLDLGSQHMVKELLSPSVAQDLQFMTLILPPGGNSGDQALIYACEKGGLVLQGTFLLKVGDEESVLNEGDSFQFWGATPHSFFNPGQVPTTVLWIIGKTLLERHL
ncbi:MAG: helix-turn-helix domain-containing protein [Hyphomicrobiaceae bacterium]